MTRLVPPYIDRLVPYVPGKPVEELERELGTRGTIKLASNESPLGPPARAIEEIRRVASMAHRYPDGSGYSLRKDLAEHHRVTMPEIALGSGSNDLIDLACRTFASAADHAVIGDPSFVCYRLGLLTANIPTTEVPLRDRMHWDVDALVAAVRPETRLLFIANPNNPTGTYLGRSELERLARDLPEPVVLVVDEAYVHFADAPDYVSALELRGVRERMIVLRTFSKVYGLAALRVGYAIAPPELVDYIDRVRLPFNVGAIAQAAARAALADTEHVERYVALNRSERTRVSNAMTELGLAVTPSQANFVLVDMGAHGGLDTYEQLLRLGVIVRPMPPPIQSFLRITIGLPKENDRLLAALADVVKGARE